MILTRVDGVSFTEPPGGDHHGPLPRFYLDEVLSVVRRSAEDAMGCR
ncbi:hypothetical protein IOD16_23465 [Saccharothrix sp. 6-C]|nr:hypothetical protein [Saccharothrix sp. 6-C]QQQ74170.1 hypothetical protein IOD16_23465 [Saccharothrix sp. 6-C]